MLHLIRPVTPLAAENQTIIKEVKNHSKGSMLILNKIFANPTVIAENNPAPAEEKFCTILKFVQSLYISFEILLKDKTNLIVKRLIKNGNKKRFI